MSEWQPIETAPKDGTHIDLWADGERLADCFWAEGEDYGHDDCHWRQCYAEASSSFQTAYDPSHWMPLPAPPKA